MQFLTSNLKHSQHLLWVFFMSIKNIIPKKMVEFFTELVYSKYIRGKVSSNPWIFKK